MTLIVVVLQMVYKTFMAIKISNQKAEESEAVIEHAEQTDFLLTLAGVGPSILLQEDLGST